MYFSSVTYYWVKTRLTGRLVQHLVLNAACFSVSFDTDFAFIINQCASIDRKEQDSFWITPDMIQAYTTLHHLGYAHSVEVWKEGEIVGGVYGVSIGKCFFAESMFHTETNASKFALIKLVGIFEKQKFFIFRCSGLYRTCCHIRRKEFREVNLCCY